MSDWPPAVLSLLASGADVATRTLLWVRPRTPQGAQAAIGLWTGAADRTLAVEGEARTYLGAQGSIEVEPVQWGTGTEIRTQSVHLAVSDEGWALVRGYVVRFAPVEVHVAVFDAATMQLAGVRRVFEGRIDGQPTPMPAAEGTWVLTFDLVSEAIAGTLAEGDKKNDASQRARDPADGFRRDSDLGAVYGDVWGTDG